MHGSQEPLRGNFSRCLYTPNLCIFRWFGRIGLETFEFLQLTFLHQPYLLRKNARN